jgi:hypothetical protein
VTTVRHTPVTWLCCLALILLCQSWQVGAQLEEPEQAINHLNCTETEKCSNATLEDIEGASIGYCICKAFDPARKRSTYFVDSSTYRGYMTYNTFCYVCHSRDANHLLSGQTEVVTQVSLVEVMQTAGYNYNRFRGKVISGPYDSSSGGPGGMPVWESNHLVNRNIDHIYVYLRALAAGKISSSGNRKPAIMRASHSYSVHQLPGPSD